LADVGLLDPFGSAAFVAEIGAEVVEVGVGVGQQVPDDDEDGSADGDDRERLPSVAVPTLVVHGDLDRLVPPANGRRIAELVPGAALAVIPGANHLFFTDQPERTNEVLLDWLRRHER